MMIKRQSRSGFMVNNILVYCSFMGASFYSSFSVAMKPMSEDNKGNVLGFS